MPQGLLRATLTLLAGGAVAQALPLLLGPWLTRLYAPEIWGQYALCMAVVANLSAVFCARYEFALPLAKDAERAADLMALCAWLALAMVAVTALFALLLACGWGVLWAIWLPLAVAASGAAQWMGMWAARAQRFKVLSGARVIQYGLASLLQLSLGLWLITSLSFSGMSQAISLDPGSANSALDPVAALHALIGATVISASLAALFLAWGAAPAREGVAHARPSWWALLSTSMPRLRTVAREYKQFPLLNSPHAFAGALQDTAAVALLVVFTGDAAAGFWGLALRYLKAPATLVGSAVSQALYPKLVGVSAATARQAVRQVTIVLSLIATPLVLVLWGAGPALFAWIFGETWRPAGELARALALYIGVHFVASPLSIVPLAWGAQAWSLKLALVGQGLFLTALTLGLWQGGLLGGAWAVSVVMTVYFLWFFIRLPAQCPADASEVRS